VGSTVDRPFEELPKRLQQVERRWRTLVEEFQESGLSVAEYCASKDLDPSQLYGWRRELGRRDRQRECRPQSTDDRPRFVEVIAPAPPRAVRLEVDLACGRTLRIVGDVDASTLAKVVTTLERLPC
jgi:transposase-like protein